MGSCMQRINIEMAVESSKDAYPRERRTPSQ